MNPVTAHFRLGLATAIIFVTLFGLVSLQHSAPGDRGHIASAQVDDNPLRFAEADRLVERCLNSATVTVTNADGEKTVRKFEPGDTALLNPGTIFRCASDALDDNGRGTVLSRLAAVSEAIANRLEGNVEPKIFESILLTSAAAYQQQLNRALNVGITSSDPAMIAAQLQEADELGQSLLRMTGRVNEFDAVNLGFLGGSVSSYMSARAQLLPDVGEQDIALMQDRVLAVALADGADGAVGTAVEFARDLLALGNQDEAFQLLIETAELIDNVESAALLYRVASSLAGSTQECAAAQDFWQRANQADGSSTPLATSSECRFGLTEDPLNPPGGESEMIATIGSFSYNRCIGLYDSSIEAGETPDRAEAVRANCLLQARGDLYPNTLVVLSNVRERAAGIDSDTVASAWFWTGEILRLREDHANASIAYELAANTYLATTPEEIRTSATGSGAVGYNRLSDDPDPGTVQAAPVRVAALRLVNAARDANSAGQFFRAVSLYERAADLLVENAPTMRIADADLAEMMLENAIRNYGLAADIAAKNLLDSDLAGDMWIRAIEAAADQDRLLAPLAETPTELLGVNALRDQTLKLGDLIETFPPGLNAVRALRRAADLLDDVQLSPEGSSGLLHSTLRASWRELARLAERNVANPFLAEELWGETGDAGLASEDLDDGDIISAARAYKDAGEQAEEAGSCERAERWYQLESETLDRIGRGGNVRSCNKVLVSYGDGISLTTAKALDEAGVEPGATIIDGNPSPVDTGNGSSGSTATGQNGNGAGSGQTGSSGTGSQDSDTTGDTSSQPDSSGDQQQPQDNGPDIADRFIEELDPNPSEGSGGSCNSTSDGTVAAGHAGMIAMPVVLLGISMLARRRRDSA